MKRVLALSLVVLVGAAGWRVGAALDSDAISMAVGVFFGVLAGIPAAILVLAARRDGSEAEPSDAPPVRYERPAYAQPQIIVVTPAPYGAAPSDSLAQAPYGALLPGSIPPRRERQFKVVGEEETWLED